MVGLDGLRLDSFLLGKDAEEVEAHREYVLRITRKRRLVATPRQKRYYPPAPRQ